MPSLYEGYGNAPKKYFQTFQLASILRTKHAIWGVSMLVWKTAIKWASSWYIVGFWPLSFRIKKYVFVGCIAWYYWRLGFRKWQLQGKKDMLQLPEENYSGISLLPDLILHFNLFLVSYWRAAKIPSSHITYHSFWGSLLPTLGKKSIFAYDLSSVGVLLTWHSKKILNVVKSVFSSCFKSVEMLEGKLLLTMVCFRWWWWRRIWRRR